MAVRLKVLKSVLFFFKIFSQPSYFNKKTNFRTGPTGKNSLQDWTALNGPTRGKFKIEMNTSSKINAEKIFDDRKADHRILNCALYTAEMNPGRKVILVTKDINLRIKAKSLNLTAEDYKTGKKKDVNEQLYTGRSEIQNVSSEVINEIYEK